MNNTAAHCHRAVCYHGWDLGSPCPARDKRGKPDQWGLHHRPLFPGMLLVGCLKKGITLLQGSEKLSRQLLYCEDEETATITILTVIMTHQFLKAQDAFIFFWVGLQKVLFYVQDFAIFPQKINLIIKFSLQKSNKILNLMILKMKNDRWFHSQPCQCLQFSPPDPSYIYSGVITKAISPWD